MAITDPILLKFRAALKALYGDRLERVVLYGSRARGDARADSDYDVAVFLKDLSDRWNEVDRIVEIETELLMDQSITDWQILPNESRRFCTEYG